MFGKSLTPTQLALAELSPNTARFSLTEDERNNGLLQTQAKHVCILGAGTRQYPLTEEEDASGDWEVWCCNGLWPLGFDKKGRFRADRWFEMHPKEPQSELDLQYLCVAPVPTYVLSPDCFEWVNNGVVFPLEQVCKLGYEAPFSSTFAYQVALALLLRFQTVRLLGIYLQKGRELLIEKPNLLHWLGILQGNGIIVEARQGFCSSTPYFYGYHYYKEKAAAEALCRNSIEGIARDGFCGSQ